MSAGVCGAAAVCVSSAFVVVGALDEFCDPAETSKRITAPPIRIEESLCLLKKSTVDFVSSISLALIAKPNGGENTKPATRRPCGPIQVSLYNVKDALMNGFSVLNDFAPCPRDSRV
jgi:hypothetical protein